MTRMIGRRAAAALSVLALASCGSDPAPVEGARISEHDRAVGAEQHAVLLAEFGGAYAGPEAAYVKQVGERIAGAAALDGQCTSTLVNTDVVNAFAVPGCYIYVTRGLFAIVNSEAELASVLGHEVGHIVGAHSQRQQRRSLWRVLGVIAVSLTGSEQLTQLAGQAAQYFTLRYSRKQEYESDLLGIRYLRRAGYDPHAAVDMLAALDGNEKFMTATSGRDEASAIPEWSRSHPLTGNRIGEARTEANKIATDPDALPENEKAYLDQVEGLLFGDDPAQGFVTGRRFAHPIMRIAFEAPTGFTLTNSPQAILLSGPGGLRGEFGGGPLEDGRLDLYARRLIEQIVGQETAQVRASETRINGLPALILELAVEGREGPVPVRLAAYDGGGGQAYHFVIVSPPDQPSADEVAALFGSFRRITAQEAASLRPRVVRTVAAGPGDTTESLSRQMAHPQGRALFLMLNGLKTNEALKPGQRVKIVTYGAADQPR